MTREEVRRFEDLDPEPEPSPAAVIATAITAATKPNGVTNGIGN
jgi:hypothetical protein